MPVSFPYLGQTLALLSAILWAFAVILFKKSGESVHPLALNLFKNSLAALLFVPTIILFGEPLFRPAPLREYAIFSLSGLLGMAVGDTLFFMSLNRIGASISAVVSYMYSPSIIILSLMFLRETLTPFQIIGVILIIAGLIFATRIKLPENLTRKTLITGIIWGILSTLATAVGVVLIKPMLNTAPLLWATQIRLLASIFGLLAILTLLPERKKIVASLFSLKSFGWTVGGTIIGTYLTLVIWLGGMKFTQASIAAPLNQLSNIFIFLFATLFLKEPITLRKLIAILIAFTGALLVFLG